MRDDQAAYRRFAADLPLGPAQSPDWVDAWMDESGTDSFLLIVAGEGGARLVLPLDLVAMGPLRIARLMGGSHANGNLPPLLGEPSGISASAIVAAARGSGRRIDLVCLERLSATHGDGPSPLTHLATQESPNVSLAVDLSGGFDAILARTPRKRKRHRAQTRKLNAAGPTRRYMAATAPEVASVLDAFFRLKAQRFAEIGLRDVFAEPGVQRFFRRLFTDALNVSPPPFVLHALEVGGTIRAITGSSRGDDRLICEFSAIANDELAQASPGEYLLFDNIEEACRDGFAVYDLGVGDEHYKRRWCAVEERQFDVIVPVSMKGRLFAAWLVALSRVKRRIRGNSVAWATVKRIRRMRGAAGGTEQD